MPRRKKKYTSVANPFVQAVPAALPEPSPRYLTAKRAAAYLSMSYMTFYRWAARAVEDGLLHPDRTTKSWRYDRVELDVAFAARAGKKAA